MQVRITCRVFKTSPSQGHTPGHFNQSPGSDLSISIFWKFPRSSQLSWGTLANLEPCLPEARAGRTDLEKTQTDDRFAGEGWEEGWVGCERAQLGTTGCPGTLRVWWAQTPPPQAEVEPAACTQAGLRIRRLEQAALSRAWAPEGARGDLPRLHPRSWFKLVWAGCGPGQLHSRSQACCLPLGLPKSRAPGAGCWGMNSAPQEAKRFLKIRSSV